MLVIRLARQGRHKYPTYRLVAAEKARAANGKFISVLGHYNPHTKELVIKKDETLQYLKNGAQPSNTVIKLLQREKVTLPDWAVLKTKKKASKQEAKAEPTEPKAEAPTEPEVTETVGAEAAAANAEAVESNATDQNITATAATEEAASDKAEAAETVAADIAANTPDN